MQINGMLLIPVRRCLVICAATLDASCMMHAPLPPLRIRRIPLRTTGHLDSAACTSCVLLVKYGHMQVAPSCYPKMPSLFSSTLPSAPQAPFVLLFVKPRRLSLSLQLTPCPIGAAFACPRWLQRASGNSASSPIHVAFQGQRQVLHSLAVTIYSAAFLMFSDIVFSDRGHLLRLHHYMSLFPTCQNYRLCLS